LADGRFSLLRGPAFAFSVTVLTIWCGLAEAASPAPDVLTAFAFDHANSFACAGIQHLTNEARYRIVSRATVVGVHRSIAAFTIEDLAKSRCTTLNPRGIASTLKLRGLLFWL
jgi:hypothetical protein